MPSDKPVDFLLTVSAMPLVGGTRTVTKESLSGEEHTHLTAYLDLSIAWLDARMKGQLVWAEDISQQMDLTMGLFRRAERKRRKAEKEARKNV